MLDAGVDGVDFRVENHGTHTDYCEDYGYNDVVLQKCGTPGKTDSETIARVRGDAYTNFLRQAKHLIASNGKRMRINLNIDWFRSDPPPARRLAYPANKSIVSPTSDSAHLRLSCMSSVVTYSVRFAQ